MKSTIYIKVCGITNSEDAEFAAQAGFNAIGFNGFPGSPRYISPLNVKKILKSFNYPNIGKVGIFVDAEIPEILKYIEAGIDTVQLHGSEPAEFAEKCAGILKEQTGFAEVWKVIKPKSSKDIQKFIEFPADKFLIDAFHKTLHGGTGKVINPEIAKFAVDNLPAPVILAGGISPDNCIEIFNMAKPFGLDVNSGVEKKPGIKDYEAIIKLFEKLDKR